MKVKKNKIKNKIKNNKENNKNITIVNSPWSFDKDHVDTWAWAKNVFTPEECQKIIEIGNSLNLRYGKVQGKKDEEITEDSVRKSLISWISPHPNTNWIYEKLQKLVQHINNEFFKFHLTGINECLQFTKYQAPDGHYHTHFDKMFNGVIRKLSLSIQLTDPSKYEGGNLEIYSSSEPLVMEKEQGMAILFPSYVLHRVTPVTKGERCSLVGWFTGNNFK